MRKITAYTHGRSDGNPGPAVIAVYAVDDKGGVVLEVAESIGNAADDFASYGAVVKALHALVEKLGEDTKKIEFDFCIDNEMIYNHLCAEEKITHPGLVPYFIEVYNLRVDSFPYLNPVNAQSKLNQKVKQLVNDALDS